MRMRAWLAYVTHEVFTADRDKISTAQNCGRVPGRARAAPLRVAHFGLHISRDFGHTFLLVGTRARAHSARRAGCCVREACCLHLSLQRGPTVSSTPEELFRCLSPLYNLALYDPYIRQFITLATVCPLCSNGGV